MKKSILIMLAAFTGLSLSAQQSVQYRSAEDKLNESYCSGMFKSTEGTIFDISSETSVNGHRNILEWLEGRVAGFQVFESRSGTFIPVIRGRIPGIFVDEQQVSASYLNSLSVHDIAMVKVIKSPFFGGFNSSSGAIAIYTVMEEEETEGDGN